MQELWCWALRYKDNVHNFVNIDRNSGGYPYKVRLIDAKLWDNLAEISQYASHFPELEIVRLRITASERATHNLQRNQGV